MSWHLIDEYCAKIEWQADFQLSKKLPTICKFCIKCSSYSNVCLTCRLMRCIKKQQTMVYLLRLGSGRSTMHPTWKLSRGGNHRRLRTWIASASWKLTGRQFVMRVWQSWTKTRKRFSLKMRIYVKLETGNSSLCSCVGVNKKTHVAGYQKHARLLETSQMQQAANEDRLEVAVNHENCLLEDIFVVKVKYSVMLPGTHVWPHTGPTNCRLRMHLGLVIPDNVRIRVGNDTG